MESKEYDIEELKEGKIKEILGQPSPVKGVYLFSDKDIPMYVGNTVTLALKVGEDDLLRTLLAIYAATELETPFNEL